MDDQWSPAVIGPIIRQEMKQRRERERREAETSAATIAALSDEISRLRAENSSLRKTVSALQRRTGGGKHARR